MKRSIISLVRGFQEQTLSEDEVRELDGLLKTDAEAREIFLRETNLFGALEEIACDESVDVPSGSSGSPTAVVPAAPAIAPPVRTAMVAGWLVAAVTAILLLASLFSTSDQQDNTIASIVGISGPLQWTGDGGQVRRGLQVGMTLPGGTIDGLSPESWIALEFLDGSTVITSGNSMLAYSDVGQKVLHLKSGNLSADVNPQPAGHPMLIHTRSAVLEVLGTSFEVNADLASTALNVTEGKVLVKRLSDGRHVEVPAQHHVVAAADQDLSVNHVPQVSHSWRSQLQDGPRRTYGRWIPANDEVGPLLHCIPYITELGKTIYAASVQVTTADAAPVMTSEHSLIEVQGRLDHAADLFVGMSLKTEAGDFAGRFQVIIPRNDFSFEYFRLRLAIDDFHLDPSLNAMKNRLPSSPNRLIVESIWCHTLYQQAGLAVASLELMERP